MIAAHHACSCKGRHLCDGGLARSARRRAQGARASTNGDSEASPTSPPTRPSLPNDGLTCIIESRDAVKDFASYDSVEIATSIQTRRTRIFLLMEEVRRLRIEQRLKGGEVSQAQELAQEKFSSAVPFLPPLEEKTLSQYYYAYFGLLAAIITFGGLASPILEVNLGLGGTSYADFVKSMNLPSQLAQVDPIVASFCGGAVGVLSALLVVEENNIKKQQKTSQDCRQKMRPQALLLSCPLAIRCHYCKGTGYLMCGNCIGSGIDPAARTACIFCAKSGKVMCTGCLCTGKQLATEHDPRIDPFD